MDQYWTLQRGGSISSTDSSSCLHWIIFLNTELVSRCVRLWVINELGAHGDPIPSNPIPLIALTLGSLGVWEWVGHPGYIHLRWHSLASPTPWAVSTQKKTNLFLQISTLLNMKQAHKAGNLQSKLETIRLWLQKLVTKYQIVVCDSRWIALPVPYSRINSNVQITLVMPEPNCFFYQIIIVPEINCCLHFCGLTTVVKVQRVWFPSEKNRKIGWIYNDGCDSGGAARGDVINMICCSMWNRLHMKLKIFVRAKNSSGR